VDVGIRAVAHEIDELDLGPKEVRKARFAVEEDFQLRTRRWRRFLGRRFPPADAAKKDGNDEERPDHA
jgi:hypothetical protein